MNEAMTQGVTLMILGMGIVFCFLTLLVIALTVMSTFLKQSADSEESAAASSGETLPVSDLQDPELLSAITAAVHSFRAKREQSSKNTK